MTACTPCMTLCTPTRLAAALAVALAASVCLPLQAQSTATQPREAESHPHLKDLDAVVVTASPLRGTVEDLARPVDMLTGERLDEAKAHSLGETVNKLPGVQSSYFGPGVGRPIVRGFDGARVQVLNDGLGAGDVSTVSVDHAVSIEPFLANQIEVLKGPATLLYGSGAIGGAVNVVDGRIAEIVPEQPLQGRAELRAGSVNRERTGMARLDAVSASGNWVFHADGLHRESGDYRIPGYAESAELLAEEGETPDPDSRGKLPNSFVRTDSGALGASWIGERGFIGLGASLYSTRYGIPGHAHEGHDDDHDHDDHDHNEEHGDDGVHIAMEQRRQELRGGWNDLGALRSLRLKLARTDYTHTEFEGSAVGTVFDNRSTESRLELVHQPWAGWDGAFGLQYAKRDFAAAGEEAFVPGSQSKDLGAFWMGARAFGPLKLELGARYDRNSLRPEAENAVPQRDFSTTSLSAAARWEVNDGLHLLVNLDRAQRAPGAEKLYSNGVHVATQSYELGDADLQRETANRGELGLHWHNGPLTVQAALYHVRYRNFTYLADSDISLHGTPLRLWVQGDSRFTGGELSADWRFLDNASGAWSLRGFADTVRARLDAAQGVREVQAQIPHGDHQHEVLAQVATGGDLPRIAPTRFGAELRWRADAWRASLGAVRYARQDRVAANEHATAGYTLVDAHLAWHRDTAVGNGLELFVDGNNLLDEEARAHTSFLKDLAPLPGRNVSVGIRLFF